MATAAAVRANSSPSREPNLSSLPSSAVPHRAPPPASLRFPSSGCRRVFATAPGILLGGAAGIALAAVASTWAFPPAATAADLLAPQLPPSLVLREPENALSLPTWAIHVSSVVEWVTAMVLVWEYGDRSGFESWKGLSWGMVPLLGGALCACTWHFFYNSESLDILVAIQAALTVIGNITMGIAAFRIYKSSQRGSEKS